MNEFLLIPKAVRPNCATEECLPCDGRGQFNASIDLVSFRSTREICSTCQGTGYLQSGKSIVHQIVFDKHPRWIQSIV